MKARYHIRIKKLSTGDTRVREQLLTDSEADKMQQKLGKQENGYVLTQFSRIRERD
jgi:hypothetical protein